MAYSLEIEGLVAHKHKLETEIERLQKKIDLLIAENARLWERVKELRRVEPHNDKTEPQRSGEEGTANHKKNEGSPRRVRSGIS